MIFHENRLLADDSHETSFLIFVPKFSKMSQNLSSAAFVIGAHNEDKVPYSRTQCGASGEHETSGQELFKTDFCCLMDQFDF